MKKCMPYGPCCVFFRLNALVFRFARICFQFGGRFYIYEKTYIMPGIKQGWGNEV